MWWIVVKGGPEGQVRSAQGPSVVILSSGL